MNDANQTQPLRAADAALSFSTTPRNIMNFTTHNTAEIDINGTCLQGEITATYAELVSLFGKPHKGDGNKVDAEWDVRFEDGSIATIYNWKNGRNYCEDKGTPTEQITEWHVGGEHKRCVDKAQIAIDLMREGKAEAQPKDKMQEAFTPVMEIMDTIKAKHGQLYADAVEVALLTRKRVELFQMVLSSLVETEIIPKDVAKIVTDIDNTISARILSVVARHAGVTSKGQQGAVQLVDWADKLMDAEQSGAKSLFGDLLKGGK